MSTNLNNSLPVFEASRIECEVIPVYQYKGNLEAELNRNTLGTSEAVNLLEDMLMVREMEEMIVRLRAGAYEPLAGFDYRGPTHVSVGQEATSVGACSTFAPTDCITSTHRGHGDSLAKGCAALRQMDQAALMKRVPGSRSTAIEELLEEALEDHVFRTLAELFGKEEGYCRGRGGSMHIADFRVGHLGANAIVGGNVPIATGAALGMRYLRNGSIVCCFAGDGAYANGVVLESVNFASQRQFVNEFAEDHRFGLPIIFLVINNHYGMTGRADREVMGVSHLSRRGAGFADNNMWAETVNGMDVLAVRDAVLRASALCRQGRGPCLVEMVTYRYYGHSLSDPRNEYRTRDEEDAWKEVDPIKTFKKQLLENQILTPEQAKALEEKVGARNARAAERAANAPDPSPGDVTKYLYTDSSAVRIPPKYANPPLLKELQVRSKNDQLTYRDAIKAALYEEMKRDARVIFYGEDVADYGGAFKVTKGLLEAFGRQRVFNTPISEAAICGTGVGAAMLGLRPVVELMYMDFTLMSADQISNQAAKWHYMSGGQVEVPLVIRVSVGGGKGYGGQHSQSLESVFVHIPGLYVVYPATPYDAKGLLKASIRDNNPVMFIESQLLYPLKGEVPGEDQAVPLGSADIKRAGGDVTIVTWGPALHDAIRAAGQLKAEFAVEAEIVDLRSLVPLDLETPLQSLRKTGRCVVVSHCVQMGSFTAEVASSLQEEGFDYLDAPVRRVGARNGIAPHSHTLEEAFLPSAQEIVEAAKDVLYLGEG